MLNRTDDPRYRKRQIVETRFSILKRKFGGDLKARIFLIQRKEIALKLIVCNLHRHLQFLPGVVFYKCRNFGFPGRSHVREGSRNGGPVP